MQALGNKRFLFCLIACQRVECLNYVVRVDYFGQNCQDSFPSDCTILHSN